MKKLLAVFLILVSGIYAQEQIINSFDSAEADTNYWAFFISDQADSTKGYIDLSYPSTNVIEGTGAMKMEYSAHNTESWGGFSKIEHWHLDSNSFYDWSLYDTLSVFYYNEVKQSESGRVHLRINLHDGSENGPNVNDVADVEYYYSFHYVLDNEPGWNEIKIPLVNNYDWDGNGFNLTGWSGIPGNQTLDLDKIKGFSLEFSINGSGSGDFVTGTILLDKLALKGLAKRSIVFFNGAAIPSTSELFVWGGGAEVELGAGATPESPNAIKWTQSDAWTGVGFNIAPTDLSFHWSIDTLKFKMKAEAGTGNLRMQWEDGLGGKVGLNFDPTADGQWHQYEFPLRDLTTFYDGATTFDYSHITVFQILTEGTGSGKIVHIDDWWTGSPVFDVLAPQAPQLVSVVPGDFVNLITWADVPGESNETYDVYYSLNPITDLTAPGIEVVKLGIVEDEQIATHVLRAPATNQAITYYYAVVCKDAAGNASEIALPSPTSVTNTAEGVTVIHPAAPTNFTVDGSVGEWASIPAFEMKVSDGSGTLAPNTHVDSDADLSVKAWVAMDNDYLYYAFDITDDINSIDTSIASYLTDGADIFFGLYDWHGVSHTSYKRGAEPDYHLRFVSNGVYSDNPGGRFIVRPGENYIFKEKFPSGYIIEGKLSFAQLAAIPNPADDIFVPLVGKRIPIDYAINDADATGQREGIMTLSPNNEDQSWADVSRWTYTWIGNSMTDVEEDDNNIVVAFDLDQNYPNPFNPSTIIKYSIPTTELVELKVFNVLGQEVASLVNEVKNAGVHYANFNASDLASGVYVYRINAGSFVSTKKMLLIK